MMCHLFLATAGENGFLATPQRALWGRQPMYFGTLATSSVFRSWSRPRTTVSHEVTFTLIHDCM